MNIDKNLDMDVEFCPNKLEQILMYAITVILFATSLIAAINCVDTIFSGFKSVHWIQFISEIIYISICIPVIFSVIDSNTLYVNTAKRYFKLKNRIVNFDDISGFKYKFGYKSFPKKSFLCVTFILYLYSGENVSFDIYFLGYEKIISDRLVEIGLAKY
ncbi:hypothetical protein IJG72_03385 [bacterium]|nr:hypothetical protein [bacterium]